MAVRTAYAPVAGAVLTAANLAKLPGGWIGYAETTTPQAGIGAATDLTSLTVTPTIGTGRRIRISAQVAFTVAASATTYLRIADSVGTVFQTSRLTLAGAGSVGFLVATAVLTPSPGAVTYKLTLQCVGSTASVDSAAGLPSFILVEDVGATP